MSGRMMAQPTVGFIFLVCLVELSSGTDIQNSTISKDVVKEPTILHDVSAAKDFINSHEYAVIGFIEDPEEPEVKYFNTIVKNHPEFNFGVSTNKDVLKHFGVKGTSVTFYRQVDNVKNHLVLKETSQIDSAKIYRFLSINELRWVTEYNVVTAIGIMACDIHVHLLLFIDKILDNEVEIIEELRTAAKELQGKVLFVKMDVSMKGNEKPMAYFKLKKTDLPKVVIYHTEEQNHNVLPDGELTAERLKSLCLRFLAGESLEEDSEKKEAKTEL
uniref:Endoplasmic reticulum protein 27 n=1 Tax=Leptobrachium leishanense TaxID=445787 RepID=A0A8C5R2Y8_9ANUR